MIGNFEKNIENIRIEEAYNLDTANDNTAIPIFTIDGAFCCLYPCPLHSHSLIRIRCPRISHRKVRKNLIRLLNHFSSVSQDFRRLQGLHLTSSASDPSEDQFQ